MRYVITQIKQIINQYVLQEIIFLGVVVLFFYECPIKYFFGINCPGCGLTRAFIAALKFDFDEAFRLHNLWPLIMGNLIYLFFRPKYRLNCRLEKLLLLTTVALLLICWITKNKF